MFQDEPGVELAPLCILPVIEMIDDKYLTNKNNDTELISFFETELHGPLLLFKAAEPPLPEEV